MTSFTPRAPDDDRDRDRDRGTSGFGTDEMAPEPEDQGSPLATHVLASLPSWLLTAIAAVVVFQFDRTLGWAAFAVLGLWILIDLLTFPKFRHYYVPQPAWRRIVGEKGQAISDLAPTGLVRVHGEIWRARSRDEGETIRQGRTVRVCAVRGMEVVVEAHSRASDTRS